MMISLFYYYCFLGPLLLSTTAASMEAATPTTAMRRNGVNDENHDRDYHSLHNKIVNTNNNNKRNNNHVILMDMMKEEEDSRWNYDSSRTTKEHKQQRLRRLLTSTDSSSNNIFQTRQLNNTSSPSLFPSSFPSLSAALSPALSPAISPALSPAISPAISPALSPAISPALSPAISPALSPALTPALSPPSLSPSFSPSLLPSSTPMVNGNTTPSLTPSTTPSVTIPPTTIIPTKTWYPTYVSSDGGSTLTPTYSEKCDVCGGSNYYVGSPLVLIDITNDPNTNTLVSCGNVEKAGQEGLIPPIACAYTTQQVIFNCNCRSSGSNVGSDFPTITPIPLCPICPYNNITNDMLHISEQYNVITLLGETMTCGNMELAVRSHVITPNSSYCTAAIDLVTQGSCGTCTNATGAPIPAPMVLLEGATFPPSLTKVPTITAVPTYVDKCTFCNVGYGYYNKNETIVLGGNVFPCFEVENKGLHGLIDPSSCSYVQQQIQSYNAFNYSATDIAPDKQYRCTCLPNAMGQSSDVPSDVPSVETVGPTSKPTIIHAPTKVPISPPSASSSSLSYHFHRSCYGNSCSYRMIIIILTSVISTLIVASI